MIPVPVLVEPTKAIATFRQSKNKKRPFFYLSPFRRFFPPSRAKSLNERKTSCVPLFPLVAGTDNSK